MSQNEVVDRDDEVLDYTQGVLKSLTQDLLKNGIQKVGDDDRKLLLAALKDQAMTAIQRKRIRVEEQVANTAENSAGLIAELLKDRNAVMMFVGGSPVQREAPKLGSEFEAPPQVPGLTELNPPQLDVDSFLRATEGITDAEFEIIHE